MRTDVRIPTQFVQGLDNLFEVGVSRSEGHVDAARAGRVPPQEKIYDAVWIGRVHRQKGIDDLLATLLYLSQTIKDFRAVLIGNLRELKPRVESMGLSTGPEDTQ